MHSKRKRYVLVSSGAVTPDEQKTFLRYVEQRYGKVKAIQVDGKPGLMVLKTDVGGAQGMRESLAEVKVAGVHSATVLTSGCIGKLKRRAAESKGSDNDEVHE